MRPYAWGDRHTIAGLQGRPVPDQPEAELWLGAHPSAPSCLVEAGEALDQAVSRDPVGVLGPGVAERFGRFPFLLKVLAAAKPLSIQVHPDRARAGSGFAREQAAGIAQDDPKRIYRDDNHKPEILCALTSFEAKCGLRPLDQTMSLISILAEAGGHPLDELANRVEAAASDPGRGLADIIGWLVRLPTDQARVLVEAAVAGAGRLGGTAASTDGSPFGPELEWTVRLDQFHQGDIGVVIALLMNHVVLAPGQALFLETGSLHAYLAGAGVELMASSDNVIRGGLTVKAVDVDELLVVVDTTPAPALVQTATDGAHLFAAPIADFSLTRIGPDHIQHFEPIGPEIILVTSGEAIVSTLTGPPRSSSLGRGGAGLVRGTEGPYRVETGAATIAWRAGVGDLALGHR
ncbi:MAG: mannose-6-phosphate isomerase, class I [Actinomycetia bacterium]|nr:mannose-6-phosphate isomerase, class I [Actinomycetes bacterium]